MRALQGAWVIGTVLAAGAALVAIGCYNTPVETSEYALGPAPLRMPSPARVAQAGHSYEDSLTGGQIFTMYCSYCHNAPALAERPFSNYKNVAAHMRVRANLTGKEYAKLMEFLRRWHDVPPPNPPPPPSPKRLIFSQPIAELRPKDEKGKEKDKGKAKKAEAPREEKQEEAAAAREANVILPPLERPQH